MMRPPPPERGRKLMRVAAVLVGAALVVAGVLHGMRSSQQYCVEATHAADLLKDVNRKAHDQSSNVAIAEDKIVKLNELIAVMQTMQERTRDAEIKSMIEKAEKQRNAYQRIAASGGQ